MAKGKRDYSQKVMQGIRGSLILAKEIQTKYPQIGKVYLSRKEPNDITLDHLVEEYSIRSMGKNISPICARVGLHYAIKGFKGLRGKLKDHPEGKPFKGLVGRRKYKEAIKAKKILLNTKNGKDAVERADGIHELNSSDHRNHSRIGHKNARHHLYKFEEKSRLFRALAKKEFWRVRGNEVVLQYGKIMAYLLKKTKEWGQEEKDILRQPQLRAFVMSTTKGHKNSGPTKSGHRKIFSKTHKKLWEKVVQMKSELLMTAST